MSDLLGSIWWMIVALGVLVTFHEFGHYWVARRCGVKVLRFSVGFGKPLWSRRDRHGTEFALAAIPLGGYVKMLDEAEGEVPASQRDQQPPQRSDEAAHGRSDPGGGTGDAGLRHGPRSCIGVEQRVQRIGRLHGHGVQGGGDGVGDGQETDPALKKG